MQFSSIKLKEGIYERKIKFTDGVNLIYSSQNTCGKTTLVRFILYGLGYPIPSTKKIKFENCEVELELESEKIGHVRVERYSKSFIEATINGSKQTYILPHELKNFHSQLFGTDNDDILDNILGAFYTDQEKGWTLLNRGRVIGDIRFNIEGLVRGVGGKDGTALIESIKKTEQDILKYKSMYSIAQYRDSVNKAGGNLTYDKSLEQMDIEIQQLLIRKNTLLMEKERMTQALKDNKGIKKYIEKLKIMIQDSHGEEIQVTANNIIGLKDEISLLTAQIKLLISKIAKVDNELDEKIKKADKENQQLAFFESESLKDIFDKRIATIPIDQITIKKELDILNSKLSKLRKTLDEKTKINNDALLSLYKNILKYANELGVNKNNTFTQNYIFTKNLKELSGAVLHKTVFAFRLGYVLAIEKALNIKLPLVLDSPSGKEVDKENIQLMMNILKRDFSDHQIIIASIFDYEFNEVNRIEIKNVLIDKPVKAKAVTV